MSAKLIFTNNPRNRTRISAILYEDDKLIGRASAAMKVSGVKKLREWARKKTTSSLKEYVNLKESTHVIHLEPTDPVALKLAHASFSDYHGKKFKVEIVPEGYEVDIRSNWEEGSRDYFAIIHLPTMKNMAVPENGGMNSTAHYKPLHMREDMCVVRHTIFRGKDLGLTFTITEKNATKMISAPAELSLGEKQVLAVTRSLISSYRPDEYRRMGLSPEKVKEIQIGLIAKGLLAKNGGITPSGKNAIGMTRPDELEHVKEETVKPVEPITESVEAAKPTEPAAPVFTHELFDTVKEFSSRLEKWLEEHKA